MPPFASPRKPRSILIVEDDLLLAAALRRLLEADGHRVVRSCDGRQAAAAVRTEPYEVLITDIMFPGMRTIDALVERSRAPQPGRILCLSRYARILPEYYLSLARKLGVRVILAKPFEQAQLLQAIDEVFAEPAAPADAWGRSEPAIVA